MNVLFDSNVILDFALKRKPFNDHAKKCFAFLEDNENNFQGYVSSSTISDLYYIISKTRTKSYAYDFIKDLVLLLEIATVDKEVILNAFKSIIDDLEDAIQESSALINDIDVIITRNEKDFKNSRIKIHNPKEFLEIYS
ncbi:MAG: PIN domain-containing protein [Candidatus Cloacimonetes bacterium]|nr:PIN domain-containing protein [Candidatus Cloacimonadota bacterium]